MTYGPSDCLVHCSHYLLLFPLLPIDVGNPCFFASVKIIFFAFNFRIFITWCWVPDNYDSSAHIVCEIDPFGKFASHHCENYGPVRLICCCFVLILKSLHILGILCFLIKWLFLNVVLMEDSFHFIDPLLRWDCNQYSSRKIGTNNS